jgi:uncharacterized protein
MNPEDQNPVPADESLPESIFLAEPMPAAEPLSRPLSAPDPPETRFLKAILFGEHGLRIGWSVAIFFILTLLFMVGASILGGIFAEKVLHIKLTDLTPVSAVLGELMQFVSIAAAVTICALIERRRITDYYLKGQRRALHFATGAAGGFAALSLLIGALYWGHWIHFGPIALSGVAILRFGAIWGIVFLLTGFVEEGSMRCYLLFTLTRGINFWWAFGLVGCMCLSGVVFHNGGGIWGVYIISALGLAPCLLLYVSKSPSAGFWQAAWVTSTFFGFIHTGNNGETWIGIFSAAAIGFVFCVSVRLTGSAWWAIGFHASWDWAQTFFYGTADSGYVAEGHYLTTAPTGAVRWSGGSAGPEGSVIVIPVVLIVLVALIAAYGRRDRVESPSPAVQPQLS